MSLDVDEDVARFLRGIRRKKIKQPMPDQYADVCPYSKTGWGIWNAGGGCTCVPTNAPTATRAEPGEDATDG